jgi:hypothetical protein
MDFSAWFRDLFWGGRWYTFDARHNTHIGV